MRPIRINVKRQQDGINCGVYAAAFVRHLSMGRPYRDGELTGIDVYDFRFYMAQIHMKKTFEPNVLKKKLHNASIPWHKNHDDTATFKFALPPIGNTKSITPPISNKRSLSSKSHVDNVSGKKKKTGNTNPSTPPNISFGPPSPVNIPGQGPNTNPSTPRNISTGSFPPVNTPGQGPLYAEFQKCMVFVQELQKSVNSISSRLHAVENQETKKPVRKGAWKGKVTEEGMKILKNKCSLLAFTPKLDKEQIGEESDPVHQELLTNAVNMQRYYTQGRSQLHNSLKKEFYSNLDTLNVALSKVFCKISCQNLINILPIDCLEACRFSQGSTNDVVALILLSTMVSSLKDIFE